MTSMSQHIKKAQKADSWKRRADELSKVLEQVEVSLSNSPQYNPWDLGPSSLLAKVRAVLGHRK